MNYTYVIIVFALCIWIPWLWRYAIKPHFEKQRIISRLQQLPLGRKYLITAQLLKQLYSNAGAKSASQKDREHLHIQEDSFTYGEINVLSFTWLLEKAKPKPGEIFFDLGCGAGKAVLTAALNFDFAHVVGVELLPSLHALANTQLSNAKLLIQSLNQDEASIYSHRLNSVEIIHSDFLQCDISHCDILFINATCLNDITWDNITEKIAHLKPGSRIIVTTKTIHNDNIELLYQGRELMSWGMNSVRIYSIKATQ